MDLGNELQYLFGTQGVLDGRQQKDVATEKYQPTIFQRMLGISGEQLQQAGRIKDQRELGGTYNAQLALYNGAPVALGEDEAAVGARLYDLKKKDARKDTLQAQHDAFMAPGAVHQRDVDSKRYNDSQKLIAYEMQQGRLDRADARKDRLLDRAESREARNQDLQLQVMQMDRADQRYNEQIERQDRKDRQASIQTLVAGLSHLGAAFAV